MKKIVFFALILLFITSSSVFAGITGKIKGSIVDSESKEPLPGVNIIIEGTTLGAAADGDGFFFIINVPPGTYSLKTSMVGYAAETIENVRVFVDRTITVDFKLKTSAIAGEEVVVTAEREIVPLDVSSSQVSSTGEEIIEIPAVKDVEQYLNMQPGIENMLIRGGGQNQTGMMIDGIMMVDERVNKPTLSSINLSSIQEISILTGGFNAEYGNVRSGMISVITKEGGRRYNGSIDYRYSPPGKKHFGPSFYSTECYYLKPYLDPDVCWEGTGNWDEKTQLQNKTFIGWNEYSARLLADDDPTNDRTPQQCQDLFRFRKFAEGSTRPRTDGEKPDQVYDMSIGGPVPLMGKYLGKLNFFLSNRFDKNMYPFEMSREFEWEDNTTLKLISNISSSMKLVLVGGYTKILAVASDNAGSYYSADDGALAQAKGYGGAATYSPANFSTLGIWRNTQGLIFTHVLSPSTYYDIRIDRMNSRYKAYPLRDRNTDKVYQFGSTFVDEAPLGNYGDSIEAQDGMRMGMHFGVARDFSTITTINYRADITSQIDRYNQIKAGFQGVYNNLDVWRANIHPNIPTSNTFNIYEKFPNRFSTYVQDKLEIEGMIANVGVRMDYTTPNTDWYDVDRYSEYYKAKYSDVFDDVAPKRSAKSQLELSPRVGVSHPITVNSKIYFNYGHFYSVPISTSYYGLDRRYPGRITYMGNPSADLERTISYELGYDHNLLNTVLIHVAGYYKDVTEQTGNVSYQNYDGSVSYATIENNNYADIRGFEVRIDKTFGKWIIGWANYNYMVATNGYVGRRYYYEDPITNRLYGLQNPYQERPIARPSFRANLAFMTPREWGPVVSGIKPLERFRISLFFNWRAGSWFTYNPNQIPGIRNNLQWEDYTNCNLRLKKTFSTGGMEFALFMDVTNLFNQKIFNGTAGFIDSSDQEDYMESLNLPKSEAYSNPVGNDRMGAKDSDYINMPNLTSAIYRAPRDVFFGIRIMF